MYPEVFAAIAYGILSVVGGIVGYAKAQSKISLIFGTISGVLLISGGILQLQGVAAGLPLALIVALALIVVFGIRLTKTQKFMPAGLMLLAGISALAVMFSSIDFLQKSPIL